MLSNQPLPHPILMRSIRSIDPITASINFLSFALVACLLSAFIYRLLIAFMKVQHASCRRSSGSWNWLERQGKAPRARSAKLFPPFAPHQATQQGNRPTSNIQHPTYTSQQQWTRRHCCHVHNARSGIWRIISSLIITKSPPHRSKTLSEWM